jgi:mono/diheme cytochrome c family protein
MLGALLLAGLSSCRQDMHDQPKYEAYEGSDFFHDSTGNRVFVEGTVARGFLNEDRALYSGQMSNANPNDSAAAKSYVASFPYPIDAAMLDRGEQRYNIYCAPCHAQSGMGDGMVVRRGYRKPPSLHDERLRTQPVGYFFDVITNGFGVMPSYADQIPVRDRWAITAYIRALQLSQNASYADVPEAQRSQLGAATSATPATSTTGQQSIDQPTGGSTAPAQSTPGQTQGNSQPGNTQSGGQR